ncbi:cytochrome P450 6B5-like [Bicyclus anynana]|uniref:unspecific monooxygenase n=1 Tax=Bicyclus anynana TaxID=110368 RepID=A0A6J1NC94_BICAN|nr:cytochrome P450 6B5-like [Bicyclus anynana]
MYFYICTSKCDVPKYKASPRYIIHLLKMAIHLVLLIFIGVLCFLYYFLFKNLNYWKIRNVPYVKPLPLFGNYKEFLLLQKHMSVIVQKMCQQFPGEPYFGSFYGTSPALIIQDPNLLKLVMAKDFYYFSGREMSDHTTKEKLNKHLFLAHGDKWKVLRTNLSPLFSSSKLKNTFVSISNFSDTLESLLAKEVKKGSSFDVKNFLSRYTIDCITEFAFGISSDTMKQDVSRNPFKKMGDKVFDTSDDKILRTICRTMWPGLFYALGFKLFEDDMYTFFDNLMTEVFQQRKETNTSKSDFVDRLAKWKIDNYITGESLITALTGDKENVSINVDNELLVAQCFMMFAAGFATTATSLSFLLYELAKDKIVQEKVIQEVDEYFTKHKNIAYECTYTMPYTASCLDESLRLYPVLGVITREVIHEYTLPTSLCLKRGDRIHIPVYHIHHNPDYFPEPEVFRPERFFGDEKKNIMPYTYMPFGEGRRMCLGNIL